MIATGEKMALLAEVIRVSVKGATESEISEELSLSLQHTRTYIQFLKSKKLVVAVDEDYFPTEKGLAYLATYDEAADLVHIEEPAGYYSGEKSAGANRGVYWDKAEIAARMREIIER